LRYILLSIYPLESFVTNTDIPATVSSIEAITSALAPATMSSAYPLALASAVSADPFVS
jgi:hypothetical protein